MVQALEVGTTLQRMQRDPQLWRSVAERMTNAELPEGVTLDDIAPKVERSSLQVPIPMMEFKFTYEWLFTTSATNNYDDNIEEDEDDEASDSGSYESD